MKHEITAHVTSGYNIIDELGNLVTWEPTAEMAVVAVYDLNLAAYSADAGEVFAPVPTSRPITQITLEFCIWLQNNAHILVSRAL